MPQVHECAHLKVVVSKQLPFAHCVHTRAPSAQGYTKTFLMSTLIFFCTKSHSTSQATAGLVAAGRLHGHQAALSAATATCRLHNYINYILPIQNILGRLALAPYGEHGTIPHEWHHLQGSHYPRGVCDSPNRPGSGSKLFYINSWAMIWSSDHPRVATKAK